MSSATSSRDPETGDDGSFRRQESQFRRWVTPSTATTGVPPQPGRYHLYVARACPWAHRTIIARHLMGLEDAIGLSFVDPIRDERGWAFTGGEYVDEVNGFDYLSEAYIATDRSYHARVTVPVLWDRDVGHDRLQRIRGHPADAGHGVCPLAEHPIELYPEPLRE